MRGPVFFSERNVYGAWVVYGTEGVKQYYGYTRKEAERLYRESCRTITERRKRKNGCAG